MKKKCLIIFVKNPKLGRAKTRLAATIGMEAALEAYKRLLQRTKAVTEELEVDKVVYYDQFVDREDLWVNQTYDKDIQIEGDLGEKMLSAFEDSFNKGYQQVCIIGSDCYDLDTEILQEAFDSLELKDAVIGPSKDGGYYLLGLSKPCSAVFENKSWSTETVRSETEQDFARLKMSYSLLKELNDVDVESDLGDWADDLVKTSL